MKQFSKRPSVEIHAHVLIPPKEISTLLLWSLLDVIVSTKGILNEQITNIFEKIHEIICNANENLLAKNEMIYFFFSKKNEFLISFSKHINLHSN